MGSGKLHEGVGGGVCEDIIHCTGLGGARLRGEGADVEVERGELVVSCGDEVVEGVLADYGILLASGSENCSKYRLRFFECEDSPC